MRSIWIIPVLASILILGSVVNQNAFSAVFIDSFDISGQETRPTSLAFNTDGTKMFVMGFAGNDVNEYACTTGFDVSTCTYSGDAERFNISGQETTPFSLAFNTDGTKMFVMGDDGNDVNEYACTTGFDVSTCAYSGDAERFNISGQETTPRSLAFNTDGTKMFVMGTFGKDVNEYACTTGFDVSTCAYSGDAERFSVFGQGASPTSLAFNTDGTKMFVMVFASDDVNEYACTTGFDVSTCAYSGDAERFNVSGQETTPFSLAFNTDGTKMFVMGVLGGDVNEYCLGVPFDISSESCGEPSPPEEQAQNIIEDVEALVDDETLSEKDGGKLTKSLDKVINALAEDTIKANEKLDKFLDKVNKLSDKGKIIDVDKDALILAVDLIPSDDTLTVDDIETVKDVLDDVTSLNEKDRKGLSNELDNAIKELTPDTGKACKELDKFIKDTQKLIDKGKLGLADGQPLIDAANLIKSSVPC